MRFARHAARGTFAALIALACLPASAVIQPEGPVHPAEVDNRLGYLLPTTEQVARAASLGATRVNWNRFGTVNSMIRHGGYLAEGYGGDPVDAARAFIRDNHTLFRLSAAGVEDLELVNDGVTPGNPGHAVLFRQRFAGLPAVADGLITVGVVHGKIYYVSSSSAGEQPFPGPAVLSPAQAWLLAAADVNRFVTPSNVTAVRDLTAKNGWHMLTVAGFAEPQRARLRALPIPAGGVRQVWETIVLDPRPGMLAAYTHYVDAANGEILRREDRVNYQGATTNTPFSGELPADGACAPRHDFEVGPGMGTIAATVAAHNPANDIFVDIYYVDPTNGPQAVAHGDTGTSPETATYSPTGGVVPGTYQVEVCSYQGAAPLPPFGYEGVFSQTDSSAQPVPFPPHWKWFGSNPALVNDPAVDVRILGCWFETDTCTYELQNLAARAPWDVVISSGKSSNTTLGNNAKSATSWASPLTPSEPYQPVADDRMYVYPFENIWNSSGPNGLGCDPQEIRAGGIDVDAAVTNMFASHNRMHDWAYFLGFTERNYNLQVSNFGLTQPDKEQDPENGNVQAGALDGGYPQFNGRNNANQITLNDGVPGITNQYLWQPRGGFNYPPCADGNFDMTIIGHEYSHAISNRMIGGPDSNIGGTHGPAMGESWSDLNAVEYQLEYGFVQPGYSATAMAAYVLGSPNKGLRNYSLDDNVLNFSNYGYDTSGPQSHADSEIWGAANWAVRQALIDKYEADFPYADAQRQKDCADGKYFAEACPGNRRWMQLQFDSFLLMSAAPSMLDARDAMLAADVARFGGANQFELWHGFAMAGMGEFAYAADGNDTAPIPNFESPLEEEATVAFSAVGSDEANAPITSARILIGYHATRSRHVADSDPLTVVDTSSETERLKTQNMGNTFKVLPGTYAFIVEAPGYGQHRFQAAIAAGGATLSVNLPTNRASGTKGATVLTSAREPTNLTPEARGTLIDDSENTGVQIGDSPLAPGGVPTDDGLVEGAYALVALGGTGPYSVRSVHVSVAGGPTNGGRLSALRKFEIRTCNGLCLDPVNDFQNVAYISADDAFPGGDFRPLQPDLNMRTFDFTPVTATHVMLRVLTNQCIGNPNYNGELDDDPANPTDCSTVTPPPIVDPLSQTATVPQPPRSFVRLTELQVFGQAVGVTIEPNVPPVVDAGLGFTLDEGQSAGLTGTATDLDGDLLTLTWTQESGPAVSNFNGANTLTPTFTAPQVDADTPLTFRLSVNDGLATVSDVVTVTVRDLGSSVGGVTGIGNNSVGALSPLSVLLVGLAGLLRRRRRN